MSANNPYFDHSTSNKRLIAGDTARAGDVNALFDAVSAGFTAAMGDIALRLPLPAGTQTSIPLTPAARAARALVFGADGHLETWPAIDAATVSKLFDARDNTIELTKQAEFYTREAESNKQAAETFMHSAREASQDAGQYANHAHNTYLATQQELQRLQTMDVGLFHDRLTVMEGLLFASLI